MIPLLLLLAAAAEPAPLTLRMQAPAQGAYGSGGYVELSRPDTPLRIPVHITNRSDAAISGTVRLSVIDTWSIEGRDSAPFRVAARGETTVEFTVRFSAATHNAQYPIHARAEWPGGSAHQVLILEPKMPDKTRPVPPVEWKPVPVPAGSRFGLWRLPVRRETATIENTGGIAAEAAPARGIFDYTASGITMTLGQRPPALRERTTVAAVEYPLLLPSMRPLKLKFTTKGDAEFAVFAGDFVGEIVPLPVRDGEADLSTWSGKPVRLKLEARNARGPVEWQQPTISGPAPSLQSAPRPPVRLGTAAGCDVSLRYGARGMLDAGFIFACGGRTVVLNGFRVSVAGDALEQPTAASELLQTAAEDRGARRVVRHRFRSWAGEFDIVIEAWVERDALRTAVRLENAPPPRPWFRIGLDAVSAGPWSEPVERLYFGHGHVVVKPGAFRHSFGGHTVAASFAGLEFANGMALVENIDDVADALAGDPAQRTLSFVAPHNQTRSYYPAATVWEAVKRIREQDTRQPSPGVAKKAGRFVFDLWEGRYAHAARDLEQAFRYGLRDSLVVWHNWQRWGYDYRLPDIYPPNPELGTPDEFRSLIEMCKRNNVLFAPHDNYIDFYPDFDGFTYKSIAFRADGQPQRAWFNYGREAQSYRARADALRPYVDRNVKLIREGLAPTAYFIDVWASMGPYDYWTDAGEFVTREVTQRAWGEAFAHVRDTLGNDAPQVSEAGHDKLIGWLDGADAQHMRIEPGGPGFAMQIPNAATERIPWGDFAWHDKFSLHGAGYPGRYDAGLDPAQHGIYSDDYMSVEVLTGRAPMVADAFSRDVVRKYWLLAGVAKALANTRIAAVEFAGGDIHRQHVTWENGAHVWVNRGSSDWAVEGHTLPQYGFYVRMPGGIEAAVERLGGHTVEWSKSPSANYANGRGHTVDFGFIRTAGGVRIEAGRELPLP